jgi:bifunctional DNase/RNase
MPRRKKAAARAAARQVAVVGVRQEKETKQPIVILKETEGRRYLPIWIGPMEATAIAFAQQGIVPPGPGPLTHDLMRDMLEVLGVRLTSADIRELKGGVFYSYLTFSNGMEVGARPSDAIALAQRTGAPVYVRHEVLDEAGVELPKATTRVALTLWAAATAGKASRRRAGRAWR